MTNNTAATPTCRFIPVTELRVGDMVAGAEVIGLRFSASGKTGYIKVRSTTHREYEYSQSTASRIAIFNR